MPNAIRCAASPASVAATVGTASDGAGAVHPAGGHRVGDRAVDRRARCRRARACAAESAPTTTARSPRGPRRCKMIAAAPVSSAPNSQRGSSMKIGAEERGRAPRSRSRPSSSPPPDPAGTTCGRAADRPDETNRVNPLTINAPTQDRQIADAGGQQRGDRRAPAAAGRCWRRRAPAAGPSGPAAHRRTGPAASRAGTARRRSRRSPTASAARSGLNSSAPASPAWNRPSPNWLTARSSSSRRNSGRPRTERHTASGCASVHHGNHVLLSSRRCRMIGDPDPQYKYPGGPRLFATDERLLVP